jgi:hypothetical protein
VLASARGCSGSASASDLSRLMLAKVAASKSFRSGRSGSERLLGDRGTSSGVHLERLPLAVCPACDLDESSVAGERRVCRGRCIVHRTYKNKAIREALQPCRLTDRDGSRLVVVEMDVALTVLSKMRHQGP